MSSLTAAPTVAPPCATAGRSFPPSGGSVDEIPIAAGSVLPLSVIARIRAFHSLPSATLRIHRRWRVAGRKILKLIRLKLICARIGRHLALAHSGILFGRLRRFQSDLVYQTRSSRGSLLPCDHSSETASLDLPVRRLWRKAIWTVLQLIRLRSSWLALEDSLARAHCGILFGHLRIFEGTFVHTFVPELYD